MILGPLHYSCPICASLVLQRKRLKRTNRERFLPRLRTTLSNGRSPWLSRETTSGKFSNVNRKLLVIDLNCMCRRIRSSFIALLFGAVLSATAVLGQSLSIIKKGETNYWIEASAPAGSPHTLQASENLHLWVDIRDNVTDPYSLELTNVSVFRRYFRLKPATEPA